MTILRALKSGHISGQKDETGSYAIDPAELHRVFPAVSEGDGHVPPSMGRSEAPPSDVVLLVGYARLEAENAALKAMLEDMRTERDRWHAQAERLALAPPQPPAPQPAAPPSRGWWPWRRSA